MCSCLNNGRPVLHKLANSDVEQIPHQFNKRNKHCVNITNSFKTDAFVASEMKIQKKTYMKVLAVCLSSTHTSRKMELINHGICTCRKNSCCFTRFLIMAFHTLWLAEICSGCEIRFSFFSRWGHEQRSGLWLVLLMSAFNRHRNVSKCSKSPQYYIYGNSFSGSAVVTYWERWRS